jgi:divalent metal cation (Fe/Co/Zn/Cd) transporter
MTEILIPEIKMKNRRRMAWISLIVGMVTAVTVIACGLFIPSLAERVNTLNTAIIALLSFLGAPVLTYMGGAVAMNWKQGK